MDKSITTRFNSGDRQPITKKSVIDSFDKAFLDVFNSFIKHYNIEHSYQIFQVFSKNNRPLTLDIGSGDGRKTSIFRKLTSNIIGLDTSIEELDKARKNGLEVILADGHFLPFKITALELL
jgi:SAM-dependent methyltransferase